MELFINDLFEFFTEIISIPPNVIAAYIQIMFHPFYYFNNAALDWGFKYFGAGLTLIAFLFNYTIPSKEYSRNKLLKWIIQIPMSKILELISKGGILYLTTLFSIPIFLCYLLFYLFSGTSSFMPYLYVMVFSLGTIYLTVSFLIIAEHFVSKAFGQISILEAWKVTMVESMVESMDLESKQKNNPLPIVNDKKGDDKATFWQRILERSKFGTNAAASFRQKLSQVQCILAGILMVYGFVYPFFCLSILRF